jgi:zinc transporter 1/2/3
MADHRIPEAIASEGLSDAMALKVVAIFVVLISGIVGAAAPVLMASCSNENGAAASRTIKNVVKVCNMLAIGIVLATALIHMIPHSIMSLQESGNPLFAEEDDHGHGSSSTASNTTSAPDSHAEHNHAYPFAFLFAMVALTVVYIAETELNWYTARKMKEIKHVACDEHEEERQASMIKLYILEAGVFVHSILIGITLGTSEELGTVRILTIVLCIHQLFEGLAIGSLSVVAQVTL